MQPVSSAGKKMQPVSSARKKGAICVKRGKNVAGAMRYCVRGVKMFKSSTQVGTLLIYSYKVPMEVVDCFPFFFLFSISASGGL